MIGELQIPLWEWWIVFYFFVGGIAGGAYFTSAIIELVGGPEDRPTARMGYYIAFPLALLSGLFLILDLGRPERFWHMVVYSKTFLPWPVWDSPISVGAYGLLVAPGLCICGAVAPSTLVTRWFRANRGRALGIAADQRSPLLPDVPTVSEAGLKGFEVTSWYGVVAPAGIPQAVATKLSAAIGQGLTSPEAVEKLKALGARPVGGTPDQFRSFLQNENTKWGKVMMASDISNK